MFLVVAVVFSQQIFINVVRHHRSASAVPGRDTVHRRPAPAAAAAAAAVVEPTARQFLVPDVGVVGDVDANAAGDAAADGERQRRRLGAPPLEDLPFRGEDRGSPERVDQRPSDRARGGDRVARATQRDAAESAVDHHGAVAAFHLGRRRTDRTSIETRLS